ncbi:MAG: hypothetical protein E7662_13220, partial [Ruminococcaceae bacterium]|nr:hypothetical protein [Oscillospiraceae bacterium]
MKKILSLCLAALMIFSVLPAAFAAEEVETIANIEETSEYAEAIKFLNTLSVYTGKENGDLAADEPVERWQMANFLYRVATGDVDHSDVKTTTNYTPFKGIDIGDFDGSCAENLGAISWAYQAKVVNGYSATEYGPTDVIIYQDAITMIVRLLGERYTAASYPYGFVTTARELGILDGITGIGLEDEISRGVVAQLLYNAMFADVDGVSLSEKVFGIEKDIVLLTATQKVAYSDSSKVFREGMVRFAELDAQGEPYGAGYHAVFEEFGLADLTAANAAVGTSYVVYHKNNYEDILSAEALWTVYENRGYDNMSVTAAKYTTLKIDGQSYRIVNEYDELNNKQGWDGDAAGTDQIKLYQAYGKTATTWNTKYILADDGNVYTIGANSLPVIYAYYSAIVDAYFAIQADGTWAKLDLSSILYTEGTLSETSIGFNKLTANSLFNTTFHSAYADYIVSDSSMDGYADRVTVKQ